MLTQVDCYSEIIRDVVLANIDDALGRLAIPPLLRIFLCAPCSLAVSLIPHTSHSAKTGGLVRLCTNNVGISVHSSELCRVGFCQWQQLAADDLKIEGVVEEELQKDRWS